MSEAAIDRGRGRRPLALRGTLRRRHPRRVIRRADGENFSPNLPRERISVGRRCRNPRNARYPNPCRRPAGQGSSCVRTWDRSNHRLPKDAPALALVCGLPARPTIVNLQLNVLAAHRQRTVAPNAVLHVKRGRESRVKPENPTPAIGLKCSRSPRTRRKSVRDGKNGRPVRRQQPPKRSTGFACRPYLAARLACRNWGGVGPSGIGL